MDMWFCNRCGRVWLESEERCPVCWGWDHMREQVDAVSRIIEWMRADLIALEQQEKSRG